ncbi:MAG: LacI family transcriptional regulator [Clostridium sp.]|nr:LacI family transcriptional regulator [Clostridium sp.]
MATIKDVARVAGVSLGTVSNVLNGKNNVKPRNRKRVYEAMKEVGFHYNMTASALRTKTTKNIGLIIPSITNPYYPELARGVEDAARQASLTVFLCNDDRDVEKERGYIQALLSKGVDGIILLKPRLSHDELMEVGRRTALVLGDAGVDTGNDFHVVNADDIQGVISAMNFLGQNGHRQIGMITGMMESYSSQSRIKAYRQYLESKRIPYREDYIIIGDYNWKCGCQGARKLMGLPDPPTAIFAANDMMAIGAIKGVQMMGYRVPEDVSIMGYDDIEMSNLSNPALTTVHQPKYKMGTECLKVLHQCINEGTDSGERRHITMDNQLIIRDSVGMVR